MKFAHNLFSRRSFLQGAASLASTAGSVMRSTQAPAADSTTSQAVVYERGGAGYEEKRRSLVWQAIKPDRYPHRIVEVASARDVAAAVKSARAEKRRISMVGSGHSYVGTGIRDETVLIHLGNLQEMTVDRTTRTATLQPGVLAVTFDGRLAQEGLAFPVAHNPGVGLAGYLLGGGMGWNAESWNELACFNVRSIEAVLASGEAIVADASHHPDLLWAARGGGPYFPAVVTRFHVNVFERPAAIRESTSVYSLDDAPAVIAWLSKAHATLSPKIELVLIFATSNPLEEKLNADKQCIVSSVCFADTEAEATHLYRGFAKDAPTKGLVFKEELQPRTIGQLLLEDKASIPNRHAVETLWTNQPESAARIMAAHFRSTPSRTTMVYLNYRARSVIPTGGAYSVGGSAFMFSDVSWDEAELDTECRSWSDSLAEALAPVGRGAYVNETEFFRHPERTRHCYSPQSWERLKRVVAKYDPQRVFASPLNP